MASYDQQFKPGEIVHVLLFGVSKCRRMHGLPYQWPTGHLWCRQEDFGSIPTAHRCPHCQVTASVDAVRYQAFNEEITAHYERKR